MNEHSACSHQWQDEATRSQLSFVGHAITVSPIVEPGNWQAMQPGHTYICARCDERLTIPLEAQRQAGPSERTTPMTSDRDAGLLYRVIWADGQQDFLAPQQLASEDFTRAELLERFQQARWDVRGQATVLSGLDRQGIRVTLAVVEGAHTRDFAPEATTLGRSDESPSEGAGVVTRIRELADRVRDLFSRSHDRGMEW
jgi:hypothetical protein